MAADKWEQTRQITREILRKAGVNPDEPGPVAPEHIEMRPHSGYLHEDERAMVDAGRAKE